MPSAVVDTEEGRRRAFEVKIDDKLIFSKLKTNIFPDIDDLAGTIVEILSKKLEKVENNKPAVETEVQKTEEKSAENSDNNSGEDHKKTPIKISTE